MTLTLRRVTKGSRLTNQELDDNFTNVDKYTVRRNNYNIPKITTTYTPDLMYHRQKVDNTIGTFHINAPSGTPYDGMILSFIVYIHGSSGGLTWDSIYADFDGITIPLGWSGTKYISFVYDENQTKWLITGIGFV